MEAARASLAESLQLFESFRRAEEAKTIRRELALLAVESNDLATARQYVAVLRSLPEMPEVPTAL
jgi:hypothetical protein